MQPAGYAAGQRGDDDFIVGFLLECVANPAERILVTDVAVNSCAKVTQPSEPDVQLPLCGFIGVFGKPRLEFGGHIARRTRRGNQ